MILLLLKRARGYFHVYFTVRTILYEMGGVQSLSSLQGDLAFNQTNNKYDIPSYRRNLRVSVLLTSADPGRTKETLDSLETNGWFGFLLCSLL